MSDLDLGLHAAMLVAPSYGRWDGRRLSRGTYRRTIGDLKSRYIRRTSLGM